MMRFRVSIAGLMAAILVVAVGFAALQNAWPWWSSASSRRASATSASPRPVQVMANAVSDRHRHWGSLWSGGDDRLPCQAEFFYRRFFGLRLSAIFPSPPVKVGKSNKNKKATTVVVHPPPSGNRFSIKKPGIIGFPILKPTGSLPPVQFIGVTG
jgi:hypothetical protein